MPVAPLVAAWGRQFPRATAGPLGMSRGASLPGTPILAQQFGQDLRLAVEIAWGANLAADQSTWLWTDVTADVMYQQKVVVKVGRADEASTPQPAMCNFTLDNRTGAYSKGPQGPNYPYVRRGTPIRVILYYQGSLDARFQGAAVGFTPNWDTTGNFATVQVQAAGTKRRFAQGTEALQSTLRRSIPTLSSLVQYWPCEDGSATGQLMSATPGGAAPLCISGTPSLASFTGFACSTAIPTFGTDSWSGQVPSYDTTSGSGQIRFLLATPAAGMPDQTRILVLSTAGSIAQIELRYQGTPALGGLRIVAYDRTHTILYDSVGTSFGVAGANVRVSIGWSISGINVQLTLSTLLVGSGAAGGITVTVPNSSLPAVTNVAFAPDGTLSGVAVGQIYVQSLVDDIFTLVGPTNAFVGEAPTDRLSRLCAEQGEQITVFSASSQQTMGAQLPDTFLNLLEACATVDQGVLWDGLTWGLAYLPRTSLENLAVNLPLAANLGQIEQPITPVDDDQLLKNQYSASRTNGATVVYTDTTSALSVNKVGTYSDSGTINCEYDAALLDFASWRVHLGNVDGYRYPTLNLALHHHPELLPYWISALRMFANRAQVTGLQSVRSQQSATPIDLQIQGWTETIDQFTWTVQVNSSPYDPWRIITLAQDVGDTSPWLCHLDTDGSTTVGDTPAGSTTMTVATTSGPIWTTAADDFPFDINANGWQITATGASSPLPINANSTFESGLAPWTATGATAVQSSTQANTGTYSAKITPDGVSSSDSLGSELIPVVAGEQYVASGWVWFTSAVTANISMSVAWYSAAGYLSTSSVPASVGAGGWAFLSNTFVPPAGATFAQLAPTLSGTPAASQVWYLDDARLNGPVQVFTLASPTPTDIPAGSPVSVWAPTYLTM